MKNLLINRPALCLLVGVIVTDILTVLLAELVNKDLSLYFRILFFGAVSMVVYFLARPADQLLPDKRELIRGAVLIPVFFLFGLACTTIYRLINEAEHIGSLKLNPQFDIQSNVLTGMFLVLLPVTIVYGTTFTYLMGRKHKIWVALLVPVGLLLLEHVLLLGYLSMRFGGGDNEMIWVVVKMYAVLILPAFVLLLLILNMSQIYFRSWSGWILFAGGALIGYACMIGPSSEFAPGVTLFTYELNMDDLATLMPGLFETDTAYFVSLTFLAVVFSTLLLLHLLAVRKRSQLVVVPPAEPVAIESDDSDEKL